VFWKRAVPVVLALAVLASPALRAADEPAPSPPAEKPPETGAQKPPEPAPIPLEDVVVTPRRSIFEQKPSERLVLSSDIERLPLIDNDLFRAVQEYPGVTGSEYNARFGVRGGESDETLVLLDGMELFEPFHLQDYGGALSILDMLAVSRADFYPGGQPAEFGDTLSGVLDVRARRPRENLQADAGADILNAHLLAGAEPLLAVARAGYIGLLMGMMDSEESFTPHFGDVMLKFDQPAGEGNELSACVLYAVDTNRMDDPGVENDVRSRYHNGMAWGKARARLSPSASLDAYLYGGWAARHRREGLTDLDERDLRYAGAKAVLDATLGGSLELKAGVDARWMEGRYRYRAAGETVDLDFLSAGTSVKAFASAKWAIADSWTATGGARLLALGPGQGTHAAPSLALSFHPGRALELKAATGIYYQPVDPLHLPVETAIVEPCEPERAVHYVFSASYRSREAKANAGFDVYAMKRDRLAGFVSDAGRKSQMAWPKTSGRTSGLELYFDKGIGDLVLHLSYTYSFSRERFQGREYWSDQDQRYAARAGVSGSLGLGWTVYAGWRYHSGNPYTRMIVEGPALLAGPRNGGRLPPYHSLDMKIGKTWETGGLKVQVYLQILNLYARRNVHEYTWVENTDGGVTTWDRRTETLFPILPTMGINIEF
jgi:hypothetical protein